MDCGAVVFVLIFDSMNVLNGKCRYLAIRRKCELVNNDDASIIPEKALRSIDEFLSVKMPA